MKMGDLAYIRVRFPGKDTLGRVAQIMAKPNDGFWLVRIIGEDCAFECAPEYLLPLAPNMAQQNEDPARVGVAHNCAED
jgi:hypothetical protein